VGQQVLKAAIKALRSGIHSHHAPSHAGRSASDCREVQFQNAINTYKLLTSRTNARMDDDKSIRPRL